jgi:hypothetical protein
MQVIDVFVIAFRLSEERIERSGRQKLSRGESMAVACAGTANGAAPQFYLGTLD